MKSKSMVKKISPSLRTVRGIVSRLLPPIPGAIFHRAKSDPFVIFHMSSKADLLSHEACLLNDLNSETGCFTILHNTPSTSMPEPS